MAYCKYKIASHFKYSHNILTCRLPKFHNAAKKLLGIKSTAPKVDASMRTTKSDSFIELHMGQTTKDLPEW